MMRRRRWRRRRRRQRQKDASEGRMGPKEVGGEH
jgi:hypothetical protein